LSVITITYSFDNLDHAPDSDEKSTKNLVGENTHSLKKTLHSKSGYVHQLADVFFNKSSVANLEEEYTNSIKESGLEVTSRTIKHASRTFDEIISQDIHFGTLLHKIKLAYDTYIQKKCGNLQSEDECLTYEALESNNKALEKTLNDKTSLVKKMESDFMKMRKDMENAYTKEKNIKDSIIHDLKARIDDLTEQLSGVKTMNDDLRRKQNNQGEDFDKDTEINNLIHDNTILNEE